MTVSRLLANWGWLTWILISLQWEKILGYNISRPDLEGTVLGWRVNSTPTPSHMFSIFTRLSVCTLCARLQLQASHSVSQLWLPTGLSRGTGLLAPFPFSSPWGMLWLSPGVLPACSGTPVPPSPKIALLKASDHAFLFSQHDTGSIIVWCEKGPSQGQVTAATGACGLTCDEKLGRVTSHQEPRSQPCFLPVHLTSGWQHKAH